MKDELRKKMGALLKLERERLDIDRNDLAEQLKIPESHLEQIEKGTSEGLPSDIYFELFAKSYAEAIGIDYAATSEAMKEEIGATYREEAAPPKSGATSKKTAKTEGDEDDDVEIIEEEEDAGLGSLKKLGILLGAVAGLLIVFLVAYKIFWASDQPLMSTEGESGAAQSESVATDQSAKFANYDWNVPAYEAPAPLILKVRAREASWATILADGDTVIFRGLGAGREYVIKANYRIQVSIALPRFVETELNGKLVNLRDPNTRRISRVIIDQLTAKKFMETEPPPVQSRPTPPPAAQPQQQTQPEVESQPADTGTTTPVLDQVIGNETTVGDSATTDNKETSLEP
jgi:transcriptional regulator with XRE-family HTH domain